jgi:hypothetical protein
MATYKVKSPLMAFRTRGGKRAFERHEPGETVELTDDEAKRLGADVEPFALPQVPAAAAPASEADEGEGKK